MKIDLIICLLFLIVDQILTDVAKTIKTSQRNQRKFWKKLQLPWRNVRPKVTKMKTKKYPPLSKNASPA